MSTTVDLYPDSGVGTTCCDGATIRTAGSESWASINGGSATGGSATGSSANSGIQASNISNEYTGLGRIQLLFDLSSIPSGSTIDNAYIHVRPHYALGTLAGSKFGIRDTTTASNTNISSSDHVLAGSTLLSNEIATGSIAVGSDNVFTLNTAGKARVASAIGGIVKFLFGETVYDRTGAAPTWVSSGRALVAIRMREYGSSTTWPRLEVEYTLSSGVKKSAFFLVM